MEDQDLKEIGITDATHRKKILHAARSLPKVTPRSDRLCFSSSVLLLISERPEKPR